LLYSTYFADPRGILDGLYQGLAYWLGSQHAYQRADQPWYYYLMLLPLYEPLGFFGSIGAAIFLFTRPQVGVWLRPPKAVGDAPGASDGPASSIAVAEAEADDANGAHADAPAAEAPNGDWHEGVIAAAAPALAPRPTTSAVALFPLFLAFWFIGSLVAFSWA